MIGLRGVPLTILLVEDNPAEATLFEEYLMAGDSDLSITHVTTLRAALERLNQAPVDVVVLDLTLPDAVGLESVRQLRDSRDVMPILVLTGSEDEGLALQCIEEGASDYLFKSEVRPQALRRAIGYALSRRHEAQIRELTITLSRLRQLASQGILTPVTAAMAGVGPLQVRRPDVFEDMLGSYRAVYDAYVAFTLFSHAKPQEAMEILAGRLGDHGGGARDLVDLHLGALESGVRVTGRQDGAKIVEGRLLALEMMGLLVDYYRSGHRRRAEREAEP